MMFRFLCCSLPSYLLMFCSSGALSYVALKFCGSALCPLVVVVRPQRSEKMHNFDLICQNDMILSTENIRQVMRDNFEVDFKGLQ